MATTEITQLYVFSAVDCAVDGHENFHFHF